MGKHLCPVCGKYEFDSYSSYDICDNCGWEDDGFQEENPDEENCANEMSLNQYKAAYESGWRPDWLTEDNKEEPSAFMEKADSENMDLGSALAVDRKKAQDAA